MSRVPSTRIVIWSGNRCMSTALMRCFTNLASPCKIFLEPFLKAYYFGSERVSRRYEAVDVMQAATFDDIKKSLEQDFEGYECLVVKDMAYMLRNRMATHVPDGFTPIFLIRHPARSFMSMWNVLKSGEIKEFEEFDPLEMDYKPIVDLHKTITDATGTPPVIVDADDILEDPEKLLKALCTQTGLTYNSKMLDWAPLAQDHLDEMKDWMPFVKTVIGSTTLKQRQCPALPDVSELPENMQTAIKDAMPHYNELHSMRLTVSK